MSAIELVVTLFPGLFWLPDRRGNSLRYPLNRRVGGPQSRSGCGGEEKHPCPCQESTPDRPPCSQSLYWSIPDGVTRWFCFVSGAVRTLFRTCLDSEKLRMVCVNDSNCRGFILLLIRTVVTKPKCSVPLIPKLATIHHDHPAISFLQVNVFLEVSAPKFCVPCLSHLRLPAWPIVDPLISRLLWNLKIHYIVHNSPPLDYILSQFFPVHILILFALEIYFNIFLPSAPICPKWYLPIGFSN
jgi:hypothetical protein